MLQSILDVLFSHCITIFDLLAVPFVLEVPEVQVPRLLPADLVHLDYPAYQEHHALP